VPIAGIRNCDQFIAKFPAMDAGPRNLKVVLLGNSGVGKTSFVCRLTTGDTPRQIDPTVGVNHQRKSVIIAAEEVNVYVWDTAGQEQFQALTPLYCHSAACALVMAAGDDLSSFNAIPNWIELLDRSCDRKPPMILLVNKSDRPSILTAEDVEKKYRENFEAIFFVSAMTGESVETAFIEAAQAAYDFQVGAPSQPELKPVQERAKGCCGR
jgi:small GTP-binding protein